MRLPNSYGSVVKLSGKRRKPYAVRLTLGWTDDGKQIQKYISYHAKRSEAIAALANYRENPYDLSTRDVTFAELYERWGENKYGGDIPNCYRAAYKRVPHLHGMAFVDIRKRHIQGEVDACELGYSSKKNIKTLCNKLCTYAIDLELVTANVASTVELPPSEESTIHHPFAPDELEYLWQHTDDTGARFALIFCYTGLRPTELLKIKTENVHLGDRYMMGGMKTAAGKNRAVPIAEKIYPFIAAMYDEAQEYLVMDDWDDKPMLTYDRLRSHVWEKSEALRALPVPHLPHDGRHTCASLLDNAGINLKTIQLILGHRSANITHRVYTHKTIEQLVEAINQI
jgi:integrase